MKHSSQTILIILLLALACKRGDLELTDTNSILLPGTGDITSARTIQEERAANQDRQKKLDDAITVLKSSLVNSKNLSSNQRDDLELKIAEAEEEKARLDAQDEELNKKLSTTEKELKDARQRNEELKKELDKAKAEKIANSKTGGTAPSNGPNSPPGDDEVPPLGPYILFHGDYCLALKDKSTAEGARLTVEVCAAAAPHQSFNFDYVDEGGAYRLRNEASQKCLKVEYGSIDFGAHLIQSTCTKTDESEQFYILGLNENDFLLQGVKSQYCFNLQPDKTLAQVICDSKLESNFQIGPPKS